VCPCVHKGLIDLKTLVRSTR